MDSRAGSAECPHTETPFPKGGHSLVSEVLPTMPSALSMVPSSTWQMARESTKEARNSVSHTWLLASRVRQGRKVSVKLNALPGALD